MLRIGGYSECGAQYHMISITESTVSAMCSHIGTRSTRSADLILTMASLHFVGFVSCNAHVC